MPTPPLWSPAWWWPERRPDISRLWAAQWTVNHPVDRSDWAPLTDDGAATLVPGATYYLSAVQAGGITRTPPERPGQWVLPVGVAVTPTALHIAPGVSCKL